jgi:hypothetical protein
MKHIKNRILTTALLTALSTTTFAANADSVKRIDCACHKHHRVNITKLALVVTTATAATALIILATRSDVQSRGIRGPIITVRVGRR